MQRDLSVLLARRSRMLSKVIICTSKTNILYTNQISSHCIPMMRVYQQEFHKPGGWELEADGGYHNEDSCPGDWWEPKVHVVDLCEDAYVVG